MSRMTWFTVLRMPVLGAAGLLAALTGCATTTPPTAPARAEVQTPAPAVRRPSIGGRTANAYWHFSVAQIEAREGRLQDAIGSLRQAIKDDPNTAALWVQLSQWLLRTDDVTGAVEAAQKAIALDASSAPARIALADLYRRQRRPADAERELEQAIALAPKAQEAYLALAQQYVEQKNYDRARAVLERLVDVQPGLVQAHYLLGRVAIETERWDDAVVALKRAIEIDPDHDASWSALGFVYETRNQSEEAIELYKNAIKVNPNNPGFVERLSDLLVRLGRLKDAQGELESLTEALPRDPRVWMKLGAIHYEQKNWDEAVAAFRQAVMLEPSNLRTRYFLATALMDSGKDDEARIELEKILRADPRSVDARVQLGFLFGRSK